MNEDLSEGANMPHLPSRLLATTSYAYGQIDPYPTYGYGNASARTDSY